MKHPRHLTYEEEIHPQYVFLKLHAELGLGLRRTYSYSKPLYQSSIQN